MVPMGAMRLGLEVETAYWSSNRGNYMQQGDVKIRKETAAFQTSVEVKA